MQRFGCIKKDYIFTTNQQAQFLKERQGERNLFYARHMASEIKNDVWYLDNGYSNHKTSDKFIFVDLVEFVKIEMKIENEFIAQAQGLGTIGVQTK